MIYDTIIRTIRWWRSLLVARSGSRILKLKLNYKKHVTDTIRKEKNRAREAMEKKIRTSAVY